MYEAAESLFLDAIEASQECARRYFDYTPPSGTVVRNALKAYDCMPAAGTSLATIVLMTGYDGNAELLFHSVGHAAREAGYRVLALEGPGQASVARNTHLKFTPQWDTVVDQVVEQAMLRPNRTVLWARSFGGVLGPLAFANSKYECGGHVVEHLALCATMNSPPPPPVPCCFGCVPLF